MINKSALVMAVALLTGCGGSDTDDSKLTINLTDAPVAGVSEVNIFINSIELKKNSDSFTFEVNKSINLLDLQGSSSVALLEGVSVDAGKYQYIRLDLDADQNSIVLASGGSFEFSIPSEAQTGLKLNSPFTLTANGHANFTLDFDVAKSLSFSAQGYKMRPTIRIIDETLAGHINGEVAAELLTDQCSEAKVYAFTGTNTAFDDLGSSAEPVTTVLVKENSYEIGFLEEGNYSLYLVCDTDDAEIDEELSAVNQSSINVTVEDKVKTQANISIVVQ